MMRIVKSLMMVALFIMQGNLFSQEYSSIYTVFSDSVPFGRMMPRYTVVYDQFNKEFWTIDSTAAATDSLCSWTYKTSVGGGGGNLFDSDREIERVPTVGTNIGASTVVDFLEYAFFFQPATITLNAGLTYEVGTSNTITKTAQITQNGETSFSDGKIMRTHPLPAITFLDFGSALSGTQSTTFAPIQGDANTLEFRFRAQTTVGNNGSPQTIYSPIRYEYSAYPYIKGTSATDYSSGVNFYQQIGVSMWKDVQVKQSSDTTKFNVDAGDDKYFYISYPASYGVPSSIKDKSGYETYPADWNTYTVNVGSSGLVNDWTESYMIIRSKVKINTGGLTFYYTLYH
jgi:hypothetical protein